MKSELDDLPPIEELQISVPEVLCDPLGEVAWMVEQLVVVKPKAGKPTLNLDTVLFVERGQRTLGKIFDVFGQVSEPHYCVRFNNSEHIEKCDIKVGLNFQNNHSNLVSTSFNFQNNQVQDSCNSSAISFNNEENHGIIKLQQPFVEKKQVDFNIPPLPSSLTNSFTNYFQNLPRKNLPLSRSTSGLADIDESVQKFTSTRSRNVASHLLQKQNSTSNILQDQHKYSNVKPSRYRLNYDFDYISFHGSCDNIDVHSSTNNIELGSSQFSSMYSVQNRFDKHSKLVSSPNSTNSSINKKNDNKSF